MINSFIIIILWKLKKSEKYERDVKKLKKSKIYAYL